MKRRNRRKKKEKINYDELRRRCIQAVTQVMHRLAVRTYVGGEGSEDGLYVSGTNDAGEWAYFTHFDPDDVRHIMEARRKGKLLEYLRDSK